MDKSAIKTLLKFIGIPLLIYSALFILLLQLNHLQISKWQTSVETKLDQNKLKFMYVFNSVFPEAKQCANTIKNESCASYTRNQLDQNLHQVLGQDNRMPLYFIRLQDDTHIEKLYQSGIYKVQTVSSPGEKQVVEMLKGRRNNRIWPQYSCCGGDDILPDFPLLGKLLPFRRYLEDFPSEIELIVPQRGEKGEIVGAIVVLYGD